jgi:hypothetical protein
MTWSVHKYHHVISREISHEKPHQPGFLMRILMRFHMRFHTIMEVGLTVCYGCLDLFRALVGGCFRLLEESYSLVVRQGKRAESNKTGFGRGDDTGKLTGNPPRSVLRSSLWVRVYSFSNFAISRTNHGGQSNEDME